MHILVSELAWVVNFELVLCFFCGLSVTNNALSMLAMHCLTTHCLRSCLNYLVLRVRTLDFFFFFFLLDDLYVKLVTLSKFFTYAWFIHHCFGICLTCAESCNLTYCIVSYVVWESWFMTLSMPFTAYKALC